MECNSRVFAFLRLLLICLYRYMNVSQYLPQIMISSPFSKANPLFSLPTLHPPQQKRDSWGMISTFDLIRFFCLTGLLCS